MTPIDTFINFILNIQILGIVKIGFLIAIGLYLIFSFMIVKEVELMNRTITGIFNLPVKIIAWFNFILAVLILIIAIIIL
jgi:hypothetical protein